MTILLAALVLFVVFGLSGLRAGAIRMLVVLIGVLVGAWMAFPMGPLVAPLFTAVGVVNPIYTLTLPPLAVFLVVQLIFAAVAYWVHEKIEWIYKYKATDIKYLAWIRLNSRLGACVGVFVGAGYLLMLAMMISVVGYLSYQLAAGNPDEETRGFRIINKARQDMINTGMDKALASVDPTPPSFIAAADLLGLLYYNPPAQERLLAYPAMLALAEKPKIKDLVEDTAFTESLMTRPGLGKILENPKVQAVVTDPAAMASLSGLNPADVLQFIREGRSDIYDKEPLLGRWKLDVLGTQRQSYLANPKITTGELLKIKVETEGQTSFRLTVAPDKQLRLRGKGVNASSSWSGAVGAYTISLDVPRLRQGKINTRFTEATIVGNKLVLKDGEDNTVLAFVKDV